jgi:polyisoprenoid-binding protein YceI
MTKKIFAIGFGIIAFACVSFMELKNTWNLDTSHSNLRFGVTHLGVSQIEGAFTNFDVKITTNQEDFSEAEITMTGAVASLSTNSAARDKDLLSESYFNSEKFPQITFKSSSVKKNENNKYIITGMLTIKDISRDVVLEGNAIYGKNPMARKEIIGLQMTGTINRKDFGIGTNLPVEIVSNEVTIVANGEITKN